VSTSESDRRLVRLLNAVLLVLCILLAAKIGAVYAYAAKHPDRPLTPLEQFAARIDGSYHDCVPLGWYPQNLPGGAYYPVVNVDVAQPNGMFQSLWVGYVSRTALRDDPRVTAVKAVLDELTSGGLLTRSEDERGARYVLTRYGRDFYYADSHLHENVEDWPYMCYSRLHVEKIAWDRAHPDVPGQYRSITKRTRVTWQADVSGAWATPFLKAHSAQLTPAASPTDVVVRRYVNGEWLMLSFANKFPHLTDPSAWKQ
jgi:hypothetical protein